MSQTRIIPRGYGIGNLVSVSGYLIVIFGDVSVLTAWLFIGYEVVRFLSWGSQWTSSFSLSIYSERTISRAVDPVRSDFQIEIQEAVKKGSSGRLLRVRYAGILLITLVSYGASLIATTLAKVFKISH